MLPSPNLKRIGAAIRKLREGQGHSQDSFADLIEMHRAYYSALERGERNMTLRTLAKVCGSLKIKMSDVLHEAGE